MGDLLVNGGEPRRIAVQQQCVEEHQPLDGTAQRDGPAVPVLGFTDGLIERLVAHMVDARAVVRAVVRRRQSELDELREKPPRLAVDDDADALSLVAELLHAAGAQVTTAQSAEEALRHLDTHPPSVLLADLGMPRVDGFSSSRR